MHDRYSDRMLRPQAVEAGGCAPPIVTYVREGNRLIPIPVGPAVTLPKAEPEDEDGA